MHGIRRVRFVAGDQTRRSQRCSQQWVDDESERLSVSTHCSGDEIGTRLNFPASRAHANPKCDSAHIRESRERPLSFNLWVAPAASDR